MPARALVGLGHFYDEHFGVVLRYLKVSMPARALVGLGPKLITAWFWAMISSVDSSESAGTINHGGMVQSDFDRLLSADALPPRSLDD